jgi:hypothetical protein
MLVDSVESEVTTAVVMKTPIYWDIMACSPLKVNWGSRETCHRHLQVRRISKARNQHEAGSKQRLFNGLHGVLFQNTGLFLLDSVFNIQWEPKIHTGNLFEHIGLLFHNVAFSIYDIPPDMFYSTAGLLVLAYFPYFEKMKRGLWDHLAVCVPDCDCPSVCVSPLIV